MNRTIRVTALMLALVAWPCAGRSAAAASETGIDEISVAGRYPTKATVIAGRNTCGSVNVEDHPTLVRHTAGDTAITLEHAGSSYAGIIDRAGRFSTAPANFSYPGADYTITLNGEFSTTGFTATVDLTKRSGSKTCKYEVRWVGRKQGSPNTIPG